MIGITPLFFKRQVAHKAYPTPLANVTLRMNVSDELLNTVLFVF